MAAVHARLPGRVVHHLPGRVRVKLDRHAVTPELLLQIEGTLGSIRGIRECQANPATGSLLIRYDQEALDLPRLAALARAADVILTDARSQQGRVADEDEAHSRLAQSISARMGALDRSVRRATGQRMDLKMVLPIGFAALAIRELMINAGNLAPIPWYVLMWYAFDSYVKLHHAQEIRDKLEATEDPVVDALMNAATDSAAGGD